MPRGRCKNVGENPRNIRALTPNHLTRLFGTSPERGVWGVPFMENRQTDVLNKIEETGILRSSWFLLRP